MNILHICLGNFYIDNFSYQENMLPRQNKVDGHRVKIIASQSTYLDNNRYSEIKTENKKSYINEYDIPVVRLNYKRYLPSKLMRRVRHYDGLYFEIMEFNPNIIFVHNFQSISMFDVIKYKKRNKDVKIYVDSHADFYTSGKNWVSRKILHGLFYKYIIKKSCKYIEKIFYISPTCGKFLVDIYKIKDNNIEFYPLGGNIIPKEKIESDFQRVREKLNINKNDIVIVQAGKIDYKKKLIETLEIFQTCQVDNIHYLICGSLNAEIEEQLNSFNDPRIRYLGWKNPDELVEILNAADIYIQPGKVSAIMQLSLCSACAVVLNNLPDNECFIKDNGWLINKISDTKVIFNSINENIDLINSMKENSYKVAKELLDYEKLAARIY